MFCYLEEKNSDQICFLSFPLFSAFVTSSLLRHHLYYVTPTTPQLPLTLFIYFASYPIFFNNGGETCSLLSSFTSPPVPSTPPASLRSTSSPTLPLSVSKHPVPNISSEYNVESLLTFKYIVIQPARCGAARVCVVLKLVLSHNIYYI